MDFTERTNASAEKTYWFGSFSGNDVYRRYGILVRWKSFAFVFISDQQAAQCCITSGDVFLLSVCDRRGALHIAAKK